MKPVLVEEIENILLEYGGLVDGKNSQAAKAIHILFYPQLKPLSALAANDDDCNKLCKAIYGFPFDPPVRGWYGGFNNFFVLQISFPDESDASLKIHFDERIDQVHLNVNVSAFTIIDEIRRLGYEPEV